MESFDITADLYPESRPLDPRVLAMLGAAARQSEQLIRDSIRRADRFIAEVTLAAHDSAQRSGQGVRPPVGPV